MNTRLTYLFFSALALSMAAMSAQAADGKTVTSSVCQGTFASDRDRAQYHTTELKAVGGEMQMNCGLPRDSIGGAMEFVEVRFEKRSAIAVTIPARVYSCNTAFHECNWRSSANGGVVANAGQHSFFVDTTTMLHSDDFGRYFSVWLRLPDGDSLMSIETREE